MENARAFSKRRERFLTLYIMQDNSSKVEHLIIIFSHYEIILEPETKEFHNSDNFN